MSDRMAVKSYKGEYEVEFLEDAFKKLASSDLSGFHFVVDSKVALLYKNELANILKSDSVLVIEALEDSKAYAKFDGYIRHFIDKKIRRGNTIVAIGGGIIQDITCFLSSILLRGVEWYFYPTTLLAQADSCIGSKSSINYENYKNLIGNFYPPGKIFVDTRVLRTLEKKDILSGLGEMLKVHMIAGMKYFKKIADKYEEMQINDSVLSHFLRRSLEIKKKFIEIDEFDKGIRNILNYGHSFGHAVESSTNFLIPHGIAVSIGMDIANYLSMEMNELTKESFLEIHATLKRNYELYIDTVIPFEGFISALRHDKKNTVSKLSLIIPDKKLKLKKVYMDENERFRNIIKGYFNKEFIK